MENRNKDRGSQAEREREREEQNRTNKENRKNPKNKIQQTNFYTNFMQRFVAGLKIKTKTKTE